MSEPTKITPKTSFDFIPGIGLVSIAPDGTQTPIAPPPVTRQVDEAAQLQDEIAAAKREKEA